jgi:hypothetical protein
MIITITERKRNLHLEDSDFVEMVLQNRRTETLQKMYSQRGSGVEEQMTKSMPIVRITLKQRRHFSLFVHSCRQEPIRMKTIPQKKMEPSAK